MIQGPSGLQKLKELMESLKKEKVSDLFTEGLSPPEADTGDQLVDRAAFLKLVKEQTLVSDDEAEAIAKMCAADKDSQKVSLKKVEEHMKNAPLSSRGGVSLTPEKAKEIIKEIYDHLRRFIATHEVNLVDLFNDQEEDDSYYNRQELAKAFQKCHFNT